MENALDETKLTDTLCVGKPVKRFEGLYSKFIVFICLAAVIWFIYEMLEIIKSGQPNPSPTLIVSTFTFFGTEFGYLAGITITKNRNKNKLQLIEEECQYGEDQLGTETIE